MIKLDAKGKPCPMPVIMAKKELEKNQPFSIVVDNETAVANLTRLANSQGCHLSVTRENDLFVLQFSAPTKTESKTQSGAYAVFFNKNTVGSGNDELGFNLAKMMLYTLTQSEDVPAYVVMMNGGVKLACDDETAAHLKTLTEMGCSVLVCGACLNFYGLSDRLQAGIVSNMYDILSAMQQVSKVITA